MAKRNSSPIVKKETIKGTNKNGKAVKRGVRCTRENGTVVTLLNPSGKADKFFKEKQSGLRRTNDGFLKRDEFGCEIPLTDSQLAYRAGYLDAQKDSAKAYKAKKSNRNGRN